MAEDHRRVEQRQIIGTGMATDAERIDRIVDEAARRERVWRPPSTVRFGDVLERAPAVASSPEEEANPRGPASSSGADAAGSSSVVPAETAALLPAAGASRTPMRPALRAPDPRARVLHARWKAGSRSTPATSSSTASQAAAPPPSTSPSTSTSPVKGR